MFLFSRSASSSKVIRDNSRIIDFIQNPLTRAMTPKCQP